MKYEKYKKLRNAINRRLDKDRKEYYRSKFYQENPSISTVWRNANDYLNTSKRSFSNTPSIIKYNGRIISSPREVANALNDIFLKKVRDLRSNANQTVTINPITRLSNFLSKRDVGVSELSLRKINKTELRNILKKRKGNRSSGIDYIDGYSIKVAAPLIEDILLHLVNLTIDKSEYPQLWKVNKV